MNRLIGILELMVLSADFWLGVFAIIGAFTVVRWILRKAAKILGGPEDFL